MNACHIISAIDHASEDGVALSLIQSVGVWGRD